MIYTIRVITKGNEVRFGFNNFGDMTAFLLTVTETVDGFETGETKVVVSREKEAPQDINL